MELELPTGSCEPSDVGATLNHSGPYCGLFVLFLNGSSNQACGNMPLILEL